MFFGVVFVLYFLNLSTGKVNVWLSLNKSIGEFSMLYECSNMSTCDL